MGDGRRSSREGRGLIRLYSTPRGDEFVAVCFCFALPHPSLLHSLVRGARTPRLAHSVPPRARISLVVVDRPRAGYRFISFVFPRPHIPLGWMASSRELNI
jgi:hypothetical protein